MGLIPKAKDKKMPIPSQANAIRKLYPSWDVSCRGGKLICRGNVKASIWGPEYNVRVIYEHKYKRPLVNLISPKIKRRNGKLPPHLLKKECLCLYYPKFNEWTKVEFIADTIIPWISLWLYYYEHWLEYGKWLGGGTKHPKEGGTVVEEPPIKLN